MAVRDSTGVLIGALAHALIGVSLVWDKILLQQRETRNLVSYVFWLGSLGIVGVAVAGFGFHMPSLSIISLGFSAGILHMISVFFYYLALKRAEASRALAIMGGFSPIATALIGIPLLGQALGGASVEGFALMTAGGLRHVFLGPVRVEAGHPGGIAFGGVWRLEQRCPEDRV